MSWISDLFTKSAGTKFRCGVLSNPKKFSLTCCGRPVKLEIPCGMAEPSVSIECTGGCGKGEWISPR